MSVGVRRLWVGLVCCLALACVHANPSGNPPAKNKLDSFLPLAVGNQWVYQTTFQGQPQPDLTVQIVREEQGFFIDDRPAPSRLRFDNEGLRDGKVRYLLKAPLEQGQKWMSVADVRTVERYEIVTVDKKMKVPAGVFDSCVTVRMEVRIDEKRSMVNEMTFAPGVGIIEIRADLLDGSRLLPQSRMQLTRFVITPSRKQT